MAISEVEVTNTNNKDFADGWAGMTFEFKVNEPVIVPLEAAIHMFGFNKQDKTQTKVRLGIANHPEGDNWLRNFKLKPIEMVRADDVEELAEMKILLEKKETSLAELSAEISKRDTELQQLRDEIASLRDGGPKTAKKAK